MFPTWASRNGHYEQDEEEERWGRREEVWRAKVQEAEASLEAAEAKEKRKHLFYSCGSGLPVRRKQVF